MQVTAPKTTTGAFSLSRPLPATTGFGAQNIDPTPNGVKPLLKNGMSLRGDLPNAEGSTAPFATLNSKLKCSISVGLHLCEAQPDTHQSNQSNSAQFPGAWLAERILDERVKSVWRSRELN